MMKTQLCEWLIINADAPIRYRVYRELLNDHKKAANLEQELLQNQTVIYWLNNLKPDFSNKNIYHGSFDSKLENACLKITQLGLHSEIKEVQNAVEYYLNDLKIKSVSQPNRFITNHLIISSNVLFSAGFKNDFVINYILESLNNLNLFINTEGYNIYTNDSERQELKGIPTIWKDKTFIKPRLTENYGIGYPLIYDLVGLSALYEMHDEEIDRKIDNIIRYISCDEYHNTVSDGYGIVVVDKTKYYGMGWDAKFPGWFNLKDYMENQFHPKILFYAMIISKYPFAVQTKWFHDFLEYLENYKTINGTFCFPENWLVDKKGYFVSGSHTSFGENRKKKNWKEIESTFYVQLLKYNSRFEGSEYGECAVE